ncbi:hypothetical protein WA556_003009 [Blastocystis sp. ATCC 50177/Nand II]
MQKDMMITIVSKMESNFIRSLVNEDGVIMAMIVLADGTILSSSGDMSDSQKIQTECLHIVDNPNRDIIQTTNGVFRVIQRDDRHVIAVSSPVGKQRCIGVYATMNGLLIVAFYWYYHEIDDFP